MNLVEIDIVRAEPAQAGIHLHEDRLARQPRAVRAGAHAAPHLGGEYDVIPLCELLQSATGNLFTRAGGVDIRRVEEIDSGLESLREERATIALIERPRLRFARRRPVAHAAETDAGHFEPSTAKFDVVHRALLVGPMTIAPRRPAGYPPRCSRATLITLLSFSSAWPPSQS